MTDTKAKIREALVTLWNQGYEASLHPRNRGHDVDEALALLDAERPSVPMAMLNDCRYAEYEHDDGERLLMYQKIADRYSYTVKEE